MFEPIQWDIFGRVSKSKNAINLSFMHTLHTQTGNHFMGYFKSFYASNEVSWYEIFHRWHHVIAQKVSHLTTSVFWG